MSNWNVFDVICIGGFKNFVGIPSTSELLSLKILFPHVDIIELMCGNSSGRIYESRLFPKYSIVSSALQLYINPLESESSVPIVVCMLNFIYVFGYNKAFFDIGRRIVGNLNRDGALDENTVYACNKP
jgi:hypothetical protein